MGKPHRTDEADMKITERPSEIHARVEDAVGRQAAMTRRDGGASSGGGNPPSRLPAHGAQTGAKPWGVSAVNKQAHVFLHLQLFCSQFHSGAGAPLFNETLTVPKSSGFFPKTIQCLCEGRTNRAFVTSLIVAEGTKQLLPGGLTTK